MLEPINPMFFIMFIVAGLIYYTVLTNDFIRNTQSILFSMIAFLPSVFFAASLSIMIAIFAASGIWSVIYGIGYYVAILALMYLALNDKKSSLKSIKGGDHWKFLSYMLFIGIPIYLIIVGFGSEGGLILAAYIAFYLSYKKLKGGKK